MNIQTAARHGRAPAASLCLLWASGCTKPTADNARLTPGTLAVVVAGETKAHLFIPQVGMPELAPGTMVRVGDDVGGFAESQELFDLKLKHSPEQLTEAERKAGPRTFPEGHPGARDRPIRVVVESGEHRGAAGSVARLHLRPAP